MSASPVQRQVGSVQRRLFLQTLVRSLIWSWFAALAVSAVWFVVEPLLIQAPPVWLRWSVLGASLIAGTAVAAAVAVMRKPSAVQAALALDSEFRLKERVTTSLMLRADEAASPAGVALLADANQRVDPLRVGDRFPVRVPWTATLVPACVVVLLLLIYFYHPDFSQVQGSQPPPATNTEAMKAEIDKMKQQLQAKRQTKKEEGPKSAELKRIEAEIDKMLSNPHETKDQVRDEIKKGDDLLDDLKKEDKQKAEQARALKEQLQQMERARKKEEVAKRENGPGKDLAKALDQGDLGQAKQEADELAKKLEAQEQADELKKKLDNDKGELSKKEKEELQDELKKKQDEALSKEDSDKLQQQLQDLKDEADELTKKNEEEEKKKDEEEKKLEDEAKKDGADQQQLQREKEQLQKDKEQLKKQQQDMKALSQQLGQAQQAMKEGKDGEAAQQLQQAGDKMAKMGGEGEQKQIAQDMQQVQQMKKALSQALAKQDAKDGQGKQGSQQGKLGNQPGQGPNQGGPGSGARPESADAKTGEEEHQAHSETDDKARLQVVDKVQAPHDRFSGPRKPSEMTDEIRRAAQEGAAASERERLTDRATAEMARGFFEKMRPPDKPDEVKPAPKP